MTDGRHTILLGGVGGDGHSVGLTILRQAFERRYRVLYLGPRSRLDDFFQLLSIANLVMVSCMDGHAKQYLRRFPDLLTRYPNGRAKWYLGGNPVLGDRRGAERQFMEMGFHRVFARFVDLRAIMDYVDEDLYEVEPARDPLQLWDATRARLLGSPPAPDDHRIAEEEIMRQRREVLGSWRTGSDASNLEDNAEFLTRQASFPGIQREIDLPGRTPLLQPRSGVALVADQLRLFKAFKAFGAPVLSYQVDSLTRSNNYVGAEEGIQESRLAPQSAINGFPVVNHGVGPLRNISRSIKVPLQTRHSTRAPELLAEISYAGGVSAYEGGPICYNVPYFTRFSLAEAIRAWQYVDRLTGLYAEKYDVTLDREYFGNLTSTLIPPSLAIVTGILEALLAVAQGVRCVSIGYAEQGHRTQDIAAIRSIKSLVPEILQRSGYSNVQVNAV
ncbi:MAG: hypothetical protein GY953_17140, partial [bacterium]|nr:hypothetical protein [bacterium]